MADQDLSKLKVAELREMLKTKGLNSVGNKQELVDRLNAAMSESSGEINEDDLLNDDELDEEKSLLDSTHDEILKSPSDSAKSTSPETPQPPAKKISLKRNISIVVPVSESKPEEEATAAKADLPGSDGEPDKKVIKMSELTAKDRSEMRAKKFAASQAAAVVVGDERLQARAARFGITAATETKPAEKLSTAKTPVSLELLKKRAERFGTVLVPELKKTEMQEKLQKRQERFGGGGSEKVAITAKLSDAAKSEYAEKALKRLERFKQAA